MHTTHTARTRPGTPPRTARKTRTTGRTAAAVAAGLLALTGCGTSGDGGTADQDRNRPDKPAASTPAQPATTPADDARPRKNGGQGLATTWRPKLSALQDAEHVGACRQPSTPACAESIDTIMDTVDQLASALEDADAYDHYPKTAARLRIVMEAQIGYEEEGCAGDPGADADGSPCFAHGLDVASAPAMLDMTLATDDPGPVPEN
ncbi:MAG TPA: hypothetical protein VFY14_07325 [Streptomyces sp.]|nr:hypothetical protein [Streptomyces sp.]